MHGTGIDCPFGNILGRIEMRTRQIELGIAEKLVVTARRTEVVLSAVVSRDVFGTVDRNAHSADRIDRGAFDYTLILAHAHSFLGSGPIKGIPKGPII